MHTEEKNNDQEVEAKKETISGSAFIHLTT